MPGAVGERFAQRVDYDYTLFLLVLWPRSCLFQVSAYRYTTFVWGALH